MNSKQPNPPSMQANCTDQTRKKDVKETGLRPKSGFCVFCNAPAITVCQRCGDFYCSLNCQQKDWHRHRYICFPMPALINAQMLEPVVVVHENLNANMCSQPQPHIQPHIPEVLKQLQVNIPSAATGIIEPSNAPYPVDGTQVILKSFRSPSRCIIYPDSIGFQSVLEKVDAYIKSCRTPKKNVQKDAYAISMLDGVYHRIQIGNKVQPGKYWVHFLDIGMTLCRVLSEIYEIPNELIQLPCYAKLVHIHGINNNDFSKNVQSHLATYNDKKFKIKYASSRTKSNIPSVILYHSDTQKSLNDEIVMYFKSLKYTPLSDVTIQPIKIEQFAEAMNSFPLKPSDITDKKTPKVKESIKKQDIKQPESPKSAKGDDTGCTSISSGRSSSLSNENIQEVKSLTTFKPPFKMQHFQTDDAKFKAFVLDNSCVDLGYVGCIKEKHMAQLLQTQNFLRTEYQDTGIPYMPKLNEYCLAKYEDEWHRAKVIECNPEDDKFTVIYIDFTNENTLSSESIRPYCKELNKDCYTTLCLIDGLPATLQPKQIEFLKKEFEFRASITIDKITDVVDSVAVITCCDIISKLRKQKLI